MELIGIDGARSGYWVLASSTIQPPDLRFELAKDLTDVFQQAANGDALVVIDVPIGIVSGPDAPAGRVCDGMARQIVGPIRASSVFTPPCREAFGSASQREASARNKEVCGRGISCQAFGIL